MFKNIVCLMVIVLVCSACSVLDTVPNRASNIDTFRTKLVEQSRHAWFTENKTSFVPLHLIGGHTMDLTTEDGFASAFRLKDKSVRFSVKRFDPNDKIFHEGSYGGMMNLLSRLESPHTITMDCTDDYCDDMDDFISVLVMKNTLWDVMWNTIYPSPTYGRVWQDIFCRNEIYEYGTCNVDAEGGWGRHDTTVIIIGKYNGEWVGVLSIYNPCEIN